MKNRKKSKINTYCTIYNIDLVVANSATSLLLLKKLYKYSNSEELDDFIISDSFAATTTAVVRKKDDQPCVLVKFNSNDCAKSIKPGDFYINTISHEAGHVCIDIFDIIHQEINYNSSESFCYLLGWVTEQLNKTLHDEIK